MILSAAPIIHARTRDVDFRANLLVVPSDFDKSTVQWARKYITDSTRYFELAGKQGRRVVFSNADRIISGISIRIGDLYQLCGKEPNYHRVDGKRVNYAFIGFVLDRKSVSAPIDIPYSMFLEQYEKYMQLRWEDNLDDTASLTATKVPYDSFDFPAASHVSAAITGIAGGVPQVLDANAESIEAFCAQAAMLAAKHPGFGFCTDIPMANCVLESKFNTVTSYQPEKVRSSIAAKTQASTQNPKSKTPATTVQTGSRLQKVQDDELEKQIRLQQLKKYFIGGALVLALILFLIIRSQLK